MGVIAADHTTICKFNYKDSQRYRPVWKAIQVLCAKTEENTASSMSNEPEFIVLEIPDIMCSKLMVPYCSLLTLKKLSQGKIQSPFLLSHSPEILFFSAVRISSIQ